MVDLTFRSGGPWGPGKGANLQASEVDVNFWELATAVLNLENNPALPNGIQSITMSGTQMTITLSNGEVMGPYTIPVLVMRWRDEWQPQTPYAQLDVVKVTNLGIYLVQLAHTSGDAFDPNIAVGGAPALMQIFGSADASLGSLPDVTLTDLSDGDALIYNFATGFWENRLLGGMAYQDNTAVAITGGYITGIPSPTNLSDAATKSYVDSIFASGAPAIPAKTMLANVLAVPAPAAGNTFSDFLDAVLNAPARGALLYRGGAGWVALSPGTVGQFLRTAGPGADPAWAVSGSGVTSITAGAGIDTTPDAIISTGSVALAAVSDNSILANVSGTTAAPAPVTLGVLLDHVLGSSRGTILTRTIGGWVTLAPGLIGQYLKTQGAGADLLWDSPAGAGTVTSVSAGTGISTGGSPITATGTVALAAIATASLLANVTGGSAAPVPITASLFFDAVFGGTRGQILYRNATAWVALAPGTAGQLLTTGGAAANPGWADAPTSGGSIANLRLLANISGGSSVAVANTLSDILDAIVSSARGTLLFRGSTGWTGLAPGTSGHVLQTGGAAGDPSWVAAAGGGSGITELTGDVAAGPGSGSQAATLANTAVTPGNYSLANITVDAKGRLIAAASGTPPPSGINQLTGDATAGPGTGLQTLTLSTSGVSAGSYTAANITVDAKGRVTAAANGGAGGGGTVTSVSAGTGLSASPSPIVGAGTLSLAVPVTVANGGTGATTLAANGALVGGGTGPITTVAPGANGTLFASTGPAALPQYRTLNSILDLLAGTAAQGQILYRGSAVWTVLAPGTAGQFLRTGGTAANVSWADPAVSDYRIKENVADLPPMWDRIKALRPVSYTIKENAELSSKADPLEQWGFIAHELQDTLTEAAATGYKDAPDLVQSPNVMVLLAPITRALQEAMGRIESLEAEINTLKAAVG